MNPGFKYPIDQNVLRSKLLESTSDNIEQAWEKFEGYLAQQKPIFTGSKKTRINLMIQPSILLRGFLAALIILPSLLFYQQFNAKIPAAIGRAYVAPVQTNKKKTIESKKPAPAIVAQPQALVAAIETTPLPESPVLGSAPASKADPVQKKTANKTRVSALSVSTDKTPKTQAVQTSPSPSVLATPIPEEMVVSPPTEQPEEYVENPL